MPNQKIKTTILITVIILSMLATLPIPDIKAEAGQANIYIIQLNNINHSWIDNTSRVVEGALEACMLNGNFIEGNLPIAHPKLAVSYPPYYKVVPKVVTSWTEYKNIVTSKKGVIVVNTHGEHLPVPNGYSKEEWVDEIANAMLNRRVTWVHVGGYPFYYVHYQNGIEEGWGDSGFKAFMSHIGKGNVDCWPPTDENELATFSLYAEERLNWFWEDKNKNKISSFHYATLGRPLKVEDFEEYNVMPIYRYNYGGKGYWTGTAIAFVNVSDRYSDKYGCGAYVHIGARYLYDIGGGQFDADYGRGFIGTAVALWIETTAFKPSYNVISEYSGMFNYYLKSAIQVNPTVIGVFYETTSETYYISVSFAFHAILKAKQDDHSFTFYTGKVNFYLGGFPSEWSDVQVKADLGDTDLSKQGKRGTTITLSGIYSENQMNAGLIAQSILFLASMVEEIAEVAAGIGGILLFAEWCGLSNNPQYTQVGVNEFDTYVDFYYDPEIDYEFRDGFRYEQISSIITIKMKVPQNERSGWVILPFTYTIGVGTQNNEAEPYVEDTLELAIWFPGAGQKDAGSGGDAGNSHSAATPTTAFVTHYGYLGGTDNSDWYMLNVQAGEIITVSMGPPAYVNFDLELYSPSDPNNSKAESHSAAGIMEALSYTADSNGYWRIKIYKVSGSGIYWFTITFGGGGGGCPYVYTWDGSAYVLDNNVLAMSEVSGGSDVEDYYKLEQPMAPIYTSSYLSTYKIMLGEFENEHSYLDKVRLIAVDHDSNVYVALTPDNQILTYTNPNPPVSAIDNYGYDWLPWLLEPDNNYYRGVIGDWLIIDFGNVDISQAAKLVLVANLEWKKDTCIHVQVLNETGVWIDAAILRTRYHWSTIIVDLSQYLPNSDNSLKIRLYFTGIHKIDYIGLDTTPQQDIRVYPAPPVSAIHSKNGVITFKLLLNDQRYTELLLGEQIQIYFTLPNQPNNKQRTYIIYIEGHYQTT